MYEDKCIFVMPTYNTYEDSKKGKATCTVHEVLEDLIAQIKKELTKIQEVIVINDGSTDGTKERLTNLLGNYKTTQLRERGRHNLVSYQMLEADLRLTISIYDMKENKGLNLAVLEGYREALRRKSDFIIKLDSDGAHDPADFLELLRLLKERSNELKLANIPGKLGFMIIRYDALKATIDEIEKSLGAEKRGIDRKTKRIIQSKFGKNAVSP